MRHTFQGHNELAGMMNAVFWAIGTTLILAAAWVNASATLAVAWACAVLLTPVIWFGARYRLTVSEACVVLKNYTVWPLGRSRRYYLDCSADLYEAWESDRAEGVYLRAGTLSDDSDVFGPYYDVRAMGRLATQVNDAIIAARGRISSRRDVNLPTLDPSDFETLEWAGPAPRVARNVRTVCVHDIDIPPGSRFILHHADWVDPARVDTIRTVELAHPTTVCGHEVAAGGKLSFWAGEVTVTGLPLTFLHRDVHVAGAKHPVTFRGDELTRFTCAAPLRRADFVFGPMSEFRREHLLAEPTWRVTLGGPLEVAGVEARKGDSVTFDGKWQPRFVSLRRRSARIGHVKLEGPLEPLVVKRCGEIDLEDCRKRGLIDPACGYVSPTQQFLFNTLFYVVGGVLYLGLQFGTIWILDTLWALCAT